MDARLGLDTQVGMAAAFNERQDVVDGSACIANASPIEASRHEDGADQDMRQRQILDVKKVDALAEDLRLMVLFDAKALPRVPPPMLGDGSGLRRSLWSKIPSTEMTSGFRAVQERAIGFAKENADILEVPLRAGTRKLR
jgi:hypothetical protein